MTNEDHRHPIFGLDNRHLSGIVFNDVIFCKKDGA